MTDPAGAVAGRIYAFRDISAERSVEQMKSDFVSTVSHELRTPLTSIYGFAETLLRQDVLFGDEERSTFLRYIASESERLTAIVDRLLSVAQLDTGDDGGAARGDGRRRRRQRGGRSAEGADGQNGHRFVVDLADEPLSAEADREKLGQVLAHLLDNAVRYSPAGGTVTVAARRERGCGRGQRRGRGRRHPARGAGADLPQVLPRRCRLQAPSARARRASGSSSPRGSSPRWAGRIWVDSGEGRGSTFVLELRAAGE